MCLSQSCPAGACSRCNTPPQTSRDSSRTLTYLLQTCMCCPFRVEQREMCGASQHPFYVLSPGRNACRDPHSHVLAHNCVQVWNTFLVVGWGGQGPPVPWRRGTTSSTLSSSNAKDTRLSGCTPWLCHRPISSGYLCCMRSPCQCHGPVRRASVKGDPNNQEPPTRTPKRGLLPTAGR